MNWKQTKHGRVRMADKTIIAIDPGPKQSAFVIWDGESVLTKNILANDELLWMLNAHPELHKTILHNNYPLVIEQVRSYGMPVGADIFDTVHWSGRFHQAWSGDVHLMPRKDVKMHLCQSPRAKDSNVIQALVDRFAYGQKNKGKGTKKEPGFFFGFKSDVWQAFALAVTWWDQNN